MTQYQISLVGMMTVVYIVTTRTTPVMNIHLIVVFTFPYIAKMNHHIFHMQIVTKRIGTITPENMDCTYRFIVDCSILY